jgi:hypothetical protein
VHATDVALDVADKAALRELRDAVSEEMKVDKEYALERALRRLDLSSSGTEITKISPLESNSASELSCVWPDERPPGVTADEWEAIIKSEVLAMGEIGCADYTLMDMDGDGKRDLLIGVYEGGTGLWSRYSAMQRIDARFLGEINLDANETQGDSTDSKESTFGYSINGRGGNQHGYWVRLQNRMYVAYLDGHYGEDTIYLLRPFVRSAEVPMLRVSYRYSFHVPRRQKTRTDDKSGRELEAGVTISTDLQRTMEGAIRKFISPYASNDSGAISVPCPSPVGISDDDKSLYNHFGPGHYTFEIVGSFSFWWKKQCHLAQVINRFGRYQPDNGLIATLNVRKPTESAEISYAVHAKRTLVGLKMSFGNFEFRI